MNTEALLRCATTTIEIAIREREELREINAELLSALKEMTAGLDDSQDTMPLIHGEDVKTARAAITLAEANQRRYREKNLIDWA